MNEKELFMEQYDARMALYNEALDAAIEAGASQEDLPVFSLEGEFPLEKDLEEVEEAEESEEE